MTHEEYKALAAVLCPQCSGITRLPDIPLRSLPLRWCLCDLQEAIDEAAKEPIGFTVKAKKAKKQS